MTSVTFQRDDNDFGAKIRHLQDVNKVSKMLLWLSITFFCSILPRINNTEFLNTDVIDSAKDIGFAIGIAHFSRSVHSQT